MSHVEEKKTEPRVGGINIPNTTAAMYSITNCGVDAQLVVPEIQTRQETIGMVRDVHPSTRKQVVHRTL